MTTQTMVETTRKLTITGTVDIDQPETRRYGSVTFAPRDVTLEFKQAAGKSWLPHKVTIAGPNLKKDGSTGASQHENSYWYADYTLDWSSTPPPAWALDLVTAHLRELNGQPAPDDAYDTPETVEAKFKQAAMIMNAARNALGVSADGGETR